MAVHAPWGMVLVDAGMLSFLKYLWNKGVRTYYSCENDGGERYVVFQDDHCADGAGAIVVQAVAAFNGVITSVGATVDAHPAVRWVHRG